MAKIKKAKKTKKNGKPVKKAKKEKLIGKIEHIFEKIQVVTTTLKGPLKVGDIIRIKGHTTDLVQDVVSMQIEHESVQKAKKGDGIGIKIKGTVRDNDKIYLADRKTADLFKQGILSAPIPSRSVIAPPKFVTIQPARPATAASIPCAPAGPAAPGRTFLAQKSIQPPAKRAPEQPKFFNF